MRILQTVLLGILAIIFISPLFSVWENVGTIDWDQHLFYHGSAVKIIQQWGQFPLWNPFYCGGVPLLANPQSRILTPFFPLYLFIGEITAIKWEIVFHFIIGVIGYYYLARIYRIKSFLWLIPAFLFLFSSYHSSHFSIGHSVFYAWMYFPLGFGFFYKSILSGKKTYAILSGSICALMLLEGGVYPLFLSLLFMGFYCLVHFIFKRSFIYLKHLGLLLTSMVLISAAKLFPMIEFITAHSRGTPAHEVIPWQAIWQIFITAPPMAQVPNAPWAWFEHSAYIGLPLFLVTLALMLTAYAPYKHKRNYFLLLLVFIFSLCLPAGTFSSLAPYSIIKKLPLFKQMQVTGRFLILPLFCASLLCLPGIRFLEEKFFKKTKNLVQLGTFIAVIALFLPLYKYNKPIWPHALTISQQELFKLVDKWKSDEFKQFITSETYHGGHAQYAAMLANRGLLNCYEPIGIESGIWENMQNDPMVLSENPQASISNVVFSPQQISFHYSAPDRSEFIINQNFIKGWQSNLGEPYRKRGRVGLLLPPGEHQVEVKYRPTSFYLGLFVSLISILGLAIRSVKARV